MRDYLRKLEPSCMEDIIAINALYRPGPLGSDMVDDFFHRKKGQVKVEYLHPLLEPILKTTYGVMLYQEQVMRVAKDLAGFSLGQADLLRRAMGSKNPEKMEQMRESSSRAPKNTASNPTRPKAFTTRWPSSRAMVLTNPIARPMPWWPTRPPI